ncbi:MAG: hypothetical protein ACJ71R_05495 [Nitrososphaeraceae archaeon]
MLPPNCCFDKTEGKHIAARRPNTFVRDMPEISGKHLTKNFGQLLNQELAMSPMSDCRDKLVNYRGIVDSWQQPGANTIQPEENGSLPFKDWYIDNLISNYDR